VPATAPLRDLVRRHTAVVDLVLGVVVAGLGTIALWSSPTWVTYDYRDPDALGVTLAGLAGIAVAVRHRGPVAAFVVASVTSLALLQLGYNSNLGGLAPLLALYTVAVRCPARVSGTAAAALAVLVGLVLSFGPVQPTVADWIGNLVVLLTGWALGRSVRVRRAYTAGLEERNRALLAAGEARTRAVTIAERTRIAREMQDLVAHGLTAMTVQASAARRLVHSDPDTAEQLLTSVEGAGHEAMKEMRRILSVLAAEDTPADRRPQPGVTDVEELVARAREQGLTVELSTSGTPAELDAGVALTAYRLVQEGLANSRQHAGRAAVRVALDWHPGTLSLAVEDNGRGRLSEHASAGDGRGLRSLRERVQAYGGRLRAGPRTGGGFAVTATLPTTPPTTPPTTLPPASPPASSTFRRGTARATPPVPAPTVRTSS
jgi:signal transduction histidine kinase